MTARTLHVAAHTRRAPVDPHAQAREPMTRRLKAEVRAIRARERYEARIARDLERELERVLAEEFFGSNPKPETIAPAEVA